MPNPVVFAFPPAVELAPAPIPASWIIDGNPQARSKRLAVSADGTSSVMVWSCTPGRFTWHYAVDETLHVISGEIHVTDHNGESRRLGSGDMVFFPAGSVSTWHVIKEVRKLAFCRHRVRAATRCGRGTSSSPFSLARPRPPERSMPAQQLPSRRALPPPERSIRVRTPRRLQRRAPLVARISGPIAAG